MDQLLRLPLRLPPNHVYRFYRGGALTDRFRGAAEPEGTVFPEDWVGSTAAAINPPGYTYEGEGLSMVEVGGRSIVIADLLGDQLIDVAGRALVERYGPTTALLVKLLDAGSLLPVPVHPTRAIWRVRSSTGSLARRRRGPSWPRARSLGSSPLASGSAFARTSPASSSWPGATSRTPTPSGGP